MPPRARALTGADQALWADYAGKITPLRDRLAKKSNGNNKPTELVAPERTGKPPPAISPPQPRPNVVAQGSKPRMIVSPLSVGAQPGGLDKATWRRFQSGKLVATRALDLHGMTAQRAFHALVSFVRTAYAEQVRCVEVVTGRGNGETGGVIRREFTHWLNLPEIRPLILGAAHPHALNSGSVRLILRRIR